MVAFASSGALYISDTAKMKMCFIFHFGLLYPGFGMVLADHVEFSAPLDGTCVTVNG